MADHHPPGPHGIQGFHAEVAEPLFRRHLLDPPQQRRDNGVDVHQPQPHADLSPVTGGAEHDRRDPSLGSHWRKPVGLDPQQPLQRLQRRPDALGRGGGAKGDDCFDDGKIVLLPQRLAHQRRGDPQRRGALGGGSLQEGAVRGGGGGGGNFSHEGCGGENLWQAPGSPF